MSECELRPKTKEFGDSLLTYYGELVMIYIPLFESFRTVYYKSKIYSCSSSYGPKNVQMETIPSRLQQNEIIMAVPELH